MKILESVILRRWVFPALTGVLLIAAFPSFNLSLLAWISLVPLLTAVHDVKPREAFRRGFWAGWIAYTGLVYWVTISMSRYGGLPWPATLPLLLLLASYMGLYVAAFSGLWVWLRARRPVAGLLLAPVLWTALEYLRGHLLTGFPWGLLGYSQYRNLSVIQIADVTGIYGVSFLIVLVNAAAAETILYGRAGKWNKAAAAAGVAAVMIAASIIYGHQRLDALGRLESRPLQVAVVQANIPQDVKWDVEFRQQSMNRYAELTRRVARLPVDLIVWPEAAMPFIFEDETFFREQVISYVREARTPVLLGSPGRTLDERRRPALTNSAFLLDGSGRTIGRQDKIHLVPFGEYVPLSSLLFFVDKMVEGIGDFVPGAQPSVLELPVKGGPTARLGVVICFEVIFPELVRQFVRDGAEMMVTITNDAWFGRSSAPYQHFSMMVFRSIENRIPFARAANTGISGFVDASGRILEASGLFTEAALSREVRIPAAGSLYTRIGDFFAVSCVIMALAAILYGWGSGRSIRRKDSHD